MLDLGFVRDHLSLVEEKLRQRGMDPAAILTDFQSIDSARRTAITEAETMKAQRNKLVEEFQRLKKDKSDTAGNLQEQKALKERITQADQRVTAYDGKLRDLLTGIPNLPDDSVPVGTSELDNVEVRRWGKPPQFDFTPKPHWELGEQLGVLDLERAAKIAGARFAVYWDLGARLERALMNFMLDLHTREHGYTEVLPPFMVNAESMYGTGNLPKFEADLFKVPLDRFEHGDRYWTPKVGELVLHSVTGQIFTIDAINSGSRSADIKLQASNFVDRGVPWTMLLRKRDLYLIPTAEVPVTNLYRDETLDGARLPISLTAYTPCFRSEAGSYGKDVRGIIRQHQFQKVELVKFAKPEQSWEEHERLTRNAEAVLQMLGLHYRTVALCTADLGFSAAKTYDIEVWLPGQGLFREISSCSNFTDFQARRANIRYRPKDGKKTQLVHTLNGSGLAIGRTWVAIVENYQQADGSVLIPEILRPYVGSNRITPKKF
jgi:seryl-tRNA synthetase